MKLLNDHIYYLVEVVELILPSMLHESLLPKAVITKLVYTLKQKVVNYRIV